MCRSVWRVCLARILTSRRGDTARIGPTSLYHFHGWFAAARRPSVRFRLRGLPGNPALQREVLDAAFALLDADAADPVMRTLEAEAEPAAEEAWACPVSFAPPGGEDGLHERIQREVNLLKPWFDVGVRNRGCTSANVSELDIDQVVEWICEFLADTTPQSSPVAECSLAEPSNLR